MGWRWSQFGMYLVVASLAGFLCSFATAASADTDMYDGHWRFTFVPYLWFPTINGTLNFTAPGAQGGASFPNQTPPGTNIGVTVGPNSYLTNLNSAFLGYFEVRKSNWSAFTDVITMSLSNQTSSVTTFNVGQGGIINVSPSFNTSTSSSFSTTLITLAASYTVLHVNNTTLDVFLGAQSVSADAGVSWTLNGPRGRFPQSGNISGSQSLVDGIVGIKGNIQLGGADSRWFIPYYLDGGGGGYTTWEAMAGVGYAFSWGDVALTYRQSVPRYGIWKLSPKHDAERADARGRISLLISRAVWAGADPDPVMPYRVGSDPATVDGS